MEGSSLSQDRRSPSLDDDDQVEESQIKKEQQLYHQPKSSTPLLSYDATTASSKSPSASIKKRKPDRGNFLDKLNDLLVDSSSSYIQWDVSGTKVCISDKSEFAANGLTKFFSHSNYNSFIRQLNMYGFKKIASGPNCASYCNEYFLRDDPEKRSSIVRSTTLALRNADKKVAKCKAEVDKTISDLNIIESQLDKAEANQIRVSRLSVGFADLAKRTNASRRRNSYS